MLDAGQKYCRMLQGEHSAILLTFIKLPFVIKILFCLFLSGRFTQVLLYLNFFITFTSSSFILRDEKVQDKSGFPDRALAYDLYNVSCFY